MVLGKLREPEKEVNMKFLMIDMQKFIVIKVTTSVPLSVLAQQRGMAWGM